MEASMQPSSSQRERERIWFNRSLITVHVPGSDTRDEFSLVEAIAVGGAMTPLHIDPICETFHLLDGELTFHLNGQEKHARAGETVVILKGVPHAFIVRSEKARIFLINAPAGDQFFRDAGVPATGPEPAPSEEDRERLKTAARKHGTIILGPPPFLP